MLILITACSQVSRAGCLLEDYLSLERLETKRLHLTFTDQLKYAAGNNLTNNRTQWQHYNTTKRCRWL